MVLFAPALFDLATLEFLILSGNLALNEISLLEFVELLLTPVFVLLGIVAIYPLLRTFELSLYAVSRPL